MLKKTYFVFYVMLLPALFYMFSCGSSSVGSDSEQKRKICKNLSVSAQKEKGASVQPPSLTVVPTRSKPFPPVVVFKNADVVASLNVKSAIKSGVLTQIENNIVGAKMLESIFSMFDLKPGVGLEHILVAVKLKENPIFPEKFQIFLRGNFKTDDVLTRLSDMSGNFSQWNLPPLVKDGKYFKIKYANINFIISKYDDNSILVSNFKSGKINISGNKEYVFSVKNITPGTSFWVVIPHSLEKLKTLPKLAKKFISKITFVTAYFNNDSLRNSELQIRIRCKTEYDARQLKELIKLGLSQVATKISTSFRKSLNLSGNTEKETVVSKGSLVRILFKEEPKQTEELINWIKNQLIANRY